MPRLIFESHIAASPEQLFEFHSSAMALKILKPRDARIEIVGGPEAAKVEDGALHVVRVRRFGIVPITWKARISEVKPPHGFVDTAEKSPFKSWRHEHQFEARGPNTTLRDVVTYELPLGILGSFANWLFVRRDLERLFALRHEVTASHFKKRVGPAN